MVLSFFDKQEKYVGSFYLVKFDKEITLFKDLLGVYENFINATSNKVKDNEYPNWSILLLLSQTLPLLNNAFTLLCSGYLRSSEIMIRVVAEATILSVYFKEFPEAEEEYRTLNYRDFFFKHKIAKMLKLVEKEGKIFITDKNGAKKIKWNKIVFENLFEESSRFVHNNPDIIYDLTINHSRMTNKTTDLIIGPQKYEDKTFKLAFRRLFNALLFSLVVLGISLNISPDKAEKEVIDSAAKITEEFNS